jgi:hypothetical protein
MCHYVLKIAETISFDEFSRSFYTETVPELCFDNDAVIYAIYSIAALDQARTGRGDDIPTSMDIHRKYLALALRHHQKDLGNINSENVDAVCVTTTIFRAFAFSLLQYRTMQPYSPPVEWLMFARTTAAVFTESYAVFRDKPGSIPQKFINQAMAFQVPKDSSEREYEDLKYLLQRDPEDIGTEAWDEEVQQAYEWAIRYYADLRVAVQTGVEQGQICRRLIIFPIFMHERLVELIRHGEPRSLVILAHYFAYLISFEHVWWIGSAGVQEVRAIAGELTGRWTRLIGWPVQVLEQCENRRRHSASEAAVR